MSNTEILKSFFENLSIGIYHDLLYKTDPITTEATSRIGRTIKTLLTDDFRQRNPETVKKVAMALKYNRIRIQNNDSGIKLLRTFYYENKKAFEQIQISDENLNALDMQNILQLIDLLRKGRVKHSEILENMIAEIETIRNTTSNLLANLETTIVTGSEHAISKDTLIFISHGSLDKPLARRLAQGLEAAGLKVWLDEKDILGGESIPDEVSKALEQCTHFSLIYSKNSQDRPWVKSELNSVIMRRNKAKASVPKIITLLLDGLTPPTLITEFKGIPFDQYSRGLMELYKVFGIDPSRLLSMTDIFRLFEKTEPLVEVIRWCFQADYFMTIGEEQFSILRDAEEYINSFKYKPENFDSVHFDHSDVSYSRMGPSPSYDEDFFIYIRSGIIGLYILEKYLQAYRWLKDQRKESP